LDEQTDGQIDLAIDGDKEYWSLTLCSAF